MEKRLRTNLVLAAITLLLVLAVWLTLQQKEAVQGHTLFAPNETISEIEFLQQGETRLALRAAQDGWQVLYPVTLPADAFQVDALLDSLHARTARRYAVEDAELAQLGLVDPEWILKVNDAVIALGATSAVGNQRYVMKDDFIYLLNDTLAYRVQRSPWDYVSRRLLQNTQIVAVTLPSGIRLERRDEKWEVSPDNTHTTSDEIQQLIDAWQRASAVRVAPAASVPRDGEALVELANGDALRFGVERRETDVLLSRDNPAVTYTLSAETADELLVLQNDAG